MGKTAGKLTSGLAAGYTKQLAPIQQYRTEAEALEHRLSELISAVYGLIPEEVALLWEIALPRMPLKLQVISEFCLLSK